VYGPATVNTIIKPLQVETLLIDLTNSFGAGLLLSGMSCEWQPSMGPSGKHDS